MPESLERILVKHPEGSKNIGPDDFVFCRSDDDPRPHDPDDLRKEVLSRFSTGVASNARLAQTDFMRSAGRRANTYGRLAVSNWRQFNSDTSG